MDEGYDTRKYCTTHGTLMAKIKSCSWQRRDGNEVRISKSEAAQLVKFDNDLNLDRVSVPRRIKILTDLLRVISLFNKPLSTARKSELKKIVLRIDNDKSFGERYKADLRCVIKQFGKWLDGGDEYPARVRWIQTTYDKKKTRTKTPSDNISEKEKLALIRAAGNSRDKAWIALCLETGMRPKEFALLKIAHVDVDGEVMLVTVPQFTKTGQRTVPVIASRPYLLTWLNEHPLRDDRNAWLWVRSRGAKVLRLQYDGFRTILRRLCAKAGITKRVTLYTARHTSYSDKAEAGWGESQIKQYHGLDHSSKQLTTYIHMRDSALIDAVKQFHGIKPDRKEYKTEHRVLVCPSCFQENGAAEIRCSKCGLLLDAREVQKEMRTKEDLRKQVGELQGAIVSMQKQLKEIIAQNVQARRAAQESTTGPVHAEIRPLTP